MRPVLGEIEIKNERREAGSGGGVKGSKFFWERCFGADGEGDGNLTGI
jgi:hypothetical protein